MSKALRATAVALCAVAALTWVDDARSQPYWDMAITGGWNRASLSGGGAKLLGDDPLNKFNVGVAFLLRADEELGFEFGVRYSRKGGSGTIDTTYAIPNFKNVTAPIGDAEVTLDYIEIPILIAGILQTGESAYVRGYAGPCLGILVSADAKGVMSGEPYEEDISDTLDNIDFALDFGASFVYAFGAWSGMIDGRYAIGLNSIDDSNLDIEIKTRTWEVSLGVLIPLAHD